MFHAHARCILCGLWSHSRRERAKDRALPNIKSASKRLRQNQKRRERNRTVRSEIRTRTKSLLQTESADEAAEAYRKVASVLDTAARKGIVSKQAAARRKSRLARYVSSLGD